MSPRTVATCGFGASGLPPALRALGQAADHRLHHRWTTMLARGKNPSIIAMAIACELAGWCWSLATMDT